MSKRVLAAVLWFIAAWYLGASLALILDLPDLLGPLLGFGAAGFFGGDPLGMIWTKPAEPSTITTVDVENLPEDLARAA